MGECLFDALPSGIFLGGAPLNVACHLSELGAQASFASAVGDDRLGRDALRRLRARGVDVDLVATDATAETGFVTAEVDAAGDAVSKIRLPRVPTTHKSGSYRAEATTSINGELFTRPW